MSRFEVVGGAPARAGLEENSRGAESASLSAPALLIEGQTDMPDEFGPFLVFSREFASPQIPCFEQFAAALAHAQWLARSTPGFTYFILCPVAAVTKPCLGIESAAVIRLRQEEAKV